MPALNHAKRTALLNSFNCISSNDLTDLNDLADGKSLLNIINDTFKKPLKTEQYESVTVVSENDKIGSEELKTGSVDVAVTDVSMTKCIDANTESEIAEKNVQESVVEPVKPPDGINKAILERFNFIQRFIDERYNMKSEEVISYSACMQANEFELAKVTIFILSEVVKYFVLINNDHLKTLSHLDVKVQEDLEECFHLFISERECLSKRKVERVLSKHAKYKTPSPSKSTSVTPRRNCFSKYRNDVPPATPTIEDVYTNSPLKSFFESPVFKKEDMILKEKEIAKTRKILHEEELKSEDLQFELNETKKKVKQKDKEIQKLKATRMQSEEKLLEYEDELKRLQEKCNSLREKYDLQKEKYEVELSQLFKEKTILKNMVDRHEKLLEYESSNKNLKDLLLDKDRSLITEKQKTEHYRSRCQEKCQEIERMNKQLKDMQLKLNELEFQDQKYRELYLAKLYEFKGAVRNEHDSLGIGENLGVIIEGQNTILQMKLDDSELKIKGLENKPKSYSMIHPEQSSVPNCKYAFNLSTPEKLDMPESPEMPKLKDLKKHSNKELTDLPDECDILSNSEIPSKHSPAIESYGTLWKNSHLEIENTNSAVCMDELKGPENCDTLENLNLCSHCNMPSKNGYNWNAIDLEGKITKMAREHAIELKKKEEELDKLKADNGTLRQQYEDSSIELKEDKKTIEELKDCLSRVEKKFRSFHIKYEKCKESLIFEKEKSKKCDYLCQKVKDMEIEKKKREDHHKSEVDDLKSSRRKKNQEIYSLNQQIVQLNKINTNLEKRLYMLKVEKQKILEKYEVKEIEKKSSDVNTTYGTKELRNEKEQRVSPKDATGKEQNANYKAESFFIDLNAGTSKDVSNESTLSGALCSRNGYQFVNDDEAEFFNQSSLEDIKKGYKEDRMEELIRRNSILPQHLQSSYPVELDLPVSTEKFYVKNVQNVENVKRENPEGELELHSSHNSKKRKLQELDTQTSELASTPVTKWKKPFKTPSSFKKLLHFSRSRRNGSIKPKP